MTTELPTREQIARDLTFGLNACEQLGTLVAKLLTLPEVGRRAEVVDLAHAMLTSTTYAKASLRATQRNLRREGLLPPV